MKKSVIPIVLGLVLFSSCATRSNLSKTVWINVAPIEKNHINGNIINSAIFTLNDSIYFYRTISVDSVVLVPQLIANGTISYNKKEKKTATINTTTINGDTINYSAKFKNKNELILITTDLVNSIYHKLN